VSPDPRIEAFGSGAVCLGMLFVGLLFLKFWRRTKDSLFLAFAAAFALLALNAALPVLLNIPSENRSGVFLLRLAAFLLIIWAVLRKNIPRGS
jgi:hypothetical protein